MSHSATLAAPARQPALVAFAALGVVATAGLAVAYPLLTYTLSLAAFGLAHVLAELRYVDSRFSPRIGARLRVGIIALLLGVVATRSLMMTGAISGTVRLWLELGMVATLAALVLPLLWQRGVLPALAGVVVAGAIGVGAALAPMHTILALAVLHNLTPIGFLAERLRGRTRRLAMLACLAVFVVVPAIIASGLPGAWLDSAGLSQRDFSLLDRGDEAARHFNQYLPAELHAAPFALAFFSAAVFLQCMHYAVVIHVLPALDDARAWQSPANTLRWPSRRLFTAFVVVCSLALFVWFARHFDAARGAYGLIAAVHAWVEIPILLLALALPWRDPTATPATAG